MITIALVRQTRRELKVGLKMGRTAGLARWIASHLVEWDGLRAYRMGQPGESDSLVNRPAELFEYPTCLLISLAHQTPKVVK
jgi:hypothetical protein